MKRRRLRAFLWGLLVLAVVAAGVGAALVLPRMPALRFLVELSRGSWEEGKPLEGAETVEAPDELGVRRLRVVRPSGERARPAVVVVHGVTEKGADDGRLLRLASAFREAGYVALVPELRGLVRLDRPDDDTGRVLRLLRAIAARRFRGVDPARVALVGVSVGGPAALGAAARFAGEGGKGVRSVLLVGAPDDLRRVARGWFKEPLPAPGATGFAHERGRAAEFARNALWRTALETAAPETDRALLRSWLEAAWTPTAAPERLGSEAGRDLAARVLRGPDLADGDVEQVLDACWGALGPLSPAHDAAAYAALGHVSCYLLHGIEDPLVPVAEMDALAARLRGTMRVRTLRSRMVAHTSVGEDDRWDHINLLDAFFDELEG